jgi:hypothetical protein
MKNLLLTLLFVTAVAALVLWMSPELRREARGLLGNSGFGPATTTAYQWQDRQGVLHYTQEPPPEGVPYRVVEVRSDTNVVPLPEALKAQ